MSGSGDSEGDAEGETESDEEAEAERETDAESDSDAESEGEPDADARSESDVETDAQREADAEIDAEQRADEAKAAPPAPRYTSPERVVRVGWPAGALGIWSVAHWLLAAAAAAPVLVFGLAAGDEAPYWGPLLVTAPDAGITLVLVAILLYRIRRLAAGSVGRARLLALSGGATLRALGASALASFVALALTDPNALALGWYGDGSLPVGELPGGMESLRLVLTSQGTWTLTVAAASVFVVGLVVEWGAAIACWFLAPTALRATLFAIVDAVLLFAFVAVTLLLPITPTETDPDAITLPAIRLAITTLFAARFLVRAIPRSLDVFEAAGAKTARWFALPALLAVIGLGPALGLHFLGAAWALPAYGAVVAVGAVLVIGSRVGGVRALLAARMMRARKSGFLTAIGLLSILAVAFSSCTLTTTLSVMGGFRDDLKRKILGNNAHVVVDVEHGTFEGWESTLVAARSADEVIGATPYVQGEVMITSATNLAGAVIRGIDPATIGDVTDLPRNLRHGRLEYLSSPERLMRLGPDEMGRGLLVPPPPPPSIEIPLDPAEEAETGSIFGDVEELLGPADLDPDTARIAGEIDEFLLPPPLPDAQPGVGAGGDPGAEEREVLPGLIVGQELARTLRLHLGDEVNVVSPHGDLGPAGRMPRTRPFRVAGIFYSGMYEFDMKMAYTTLEAAQRFLGVGDAISGVEIKVEDTDRAENVARAVEAALGRPELRVRAWQEVNRNLFGALQLEKLAMFITLGIAILVASFCIVGSLTLMVQEKGKEVGILKAMGASGEQIVAVFMAQGLMIGLLGALMGLGLGYVTCFAMEHFGIHLNPEVYYIDRLPVHIEPSEFVLTGVAAVVVCLLATIYPAILGSRLRPVDALRYT